MLRTPSLHYDILRREVPTGWEMYKTVRSGHTSFSDDELKEGRILKAMNDLDETTRHMTYAMMMYERFGQNTFVVGPKVQELFRRTELTRITEDMIEAPVTSFYVALPDCPWRIWGGSRTRLHEVRGVYVTFGKSVSTPNAKVASRCLNFVLWGAPNKNSLGPGDDALLWFSINLDECFSSGEDFEAFFRQTSVMTAEAGRYEVKWRGYDPFDIFDGKLLPRDQEVLLEQRGTLVNIVRLVLNVCLYVASEEPDLEVVDNKEKVKELKRQAARKKSEGNKKKIERRIANLPKVKFVYIGPLFEEVGKKPSADRGDGTHASPVEHEVPPHYQHYWVGPQGQRRRVLRYKGMYIRGAGAPDRTIVKIRE